MHIVITGASGLAGSAILRQAVIDTSVTKITVLSRRSIRQVAFNDKVDLVLHSDFANFSDDIFRKISDASACIWALGTSSVGVTDEEYFTITHDWPIAFVEQLRRYRMQTHASSAPFAFVYLSAIDASSSERARMYQRVKGQTDTQLASLASQYQRSQFPLISVSLRPGGIFNEGSWQASRPLTPSIKFLQRPFLKLLNLFVPSLVISDNDLARSALRLARWHASAQDLPDGRSLVVANGRLRALSKA